MIELINKIIKFPRIRNVGVECSSHPCGTIIKPLKTKDKIHKIADNFKIKLVKSCCFLPNFVRVCRKKLGNIWAIFMIRSILSLLAIAFITVGPAAAKTPDYGQPPAEGRTTGYWATVEKVVDGDTYWADGVKYREAEIDTPETHQDPKSGYKCDAERRLGELATVEAEALLLGRKVWIKPTGRIGQYGRPIVRTRVGRFKWYDEHMLRARLAAPYQGRKHRWCEELNY